MMTLHKLCASIFIACILSSFTIQAQFFTGTEEIGVSQDFYAMQDKMNAYFKANPGLKEEKHWGRLESFLEPRVYPHGNIGQYRQSTIAAQERFFSTMSVETRSPHGAWYFIGPSSSPTGSFGRCLRAKFHPTDTNIIFVLSSSGGLWKSTDNASTWTNLTLDIPLLFAVDFVLDPGDPDIIYLLTGNDRQISAGLKVTRGILKTTDGGNIWKQTQYNFPSSVWPFKLIMHPDNPLVMYATTAGGIHATNNGWVTASTVLSPTQETRDIEFQPGNPNVMYASTRNEVYRSTMGGTSGSWDLITDDDFGGLDSMRRIELAVAPSDSNCIYLVASDDQAEYVMRSMSSGMDSTWVVMDDTTDLFWGQAGYNMAITVDPFDHNTIYIGAIALWKSTAGGVGGSWTDVNGIHADHHDFGFNNGYLYDLNDGGVGRSDNVGTSWTNITAGIQVFETYDIAGTPQDTNLIYAGGQDTGGNRIDPGGIFVRMIGSGDVTTCLQDPTDVNKSYMAAQGGGLRFTSDAWSSYDDAGSGGANFEPEFGDGIWLCPYELDPGNPDFIFTGKDSIWRLDMNAQTSQWLGFPDTGKTRAIAQGTNNRNQMYIIHGNGNNLYRTTEALTNSASGATWTPIPNDFTVGAMMRDVTVNPQDVNEVYIVYSGNAAGQKVFFSNSAGNVNTWQNISGNLPNVSINDILFHDNGLNNHALYIGTDIGVFYRDDSTPEWVYFRQGMPSSPVMELYINPTSGDLYAATLGRGVWKTDVHGNCPGVIILTGSADTGGQRYYTALDRVTSFKEYDIVNTTDIHYQAGDYVEMLPPFQIKLPGTFRARPGGCPQTLD